MINKSRSTISETISLAELPDEAKKFAGIHNLPKRDLVRIARSKVSPEEKISAIRACIDKEHASERREKLVDTFSDMPKAIQFWGNVTRRLDTMKINKMSAENKSLMSGQLEALRVTIDETITKLKG